MRIIPAVTIPEITPNWDAPWLTGLQILASYILATALLLALIALIIAVLSLIFRGIFPDSVRDWAGKNIVTIFFATAILGAISGIFHWFVNFNFGF
ncbi:hypothetical protein A9Z40_02020 [Microbacterium arborescens]|uniref:Uncharacterized protein n=1 Tax=Microbacterium arborescens TaxID=33883 RepID=A0ABX2WJ54_9MICO|nr:hypothetical protein [Microbacterium arborescens]OAZ41476.1 hypothetical protein A9Z40_02020 [Microbacterium arborescens]